MEQLIKKEDFREIDGKLWLSTGELSEKLGFKNPRGLSKVFAKNKDVVMPFTTISKLETVTGEKDTRLYNLQGCLLMAMQSQTKQAQIFKVQASRLLAELREGELGIITKKQFAELQLEKLKLEHQYIFEQINLHYRNVDLLCATKKGLSSRNKEAIRRSLTLKISVDYVSKIFDVNPEYIQIFSNYISQYNELCQQKAEVFQSIKELKEEYGIVEEPKPWLQLVEVA